MSQGPTPNAAAPEQLPTLTARPTSAAPAAAPATLTAKAAARPALRVRYWEHMDPASQSLYPVD
jgi:hypothetical protein